MFNVLLLATNTIIMYVLCLILTTNTIIMYVFCLIVKHMLSG